MAHGGQRAHRQDGADMRPSAPDHPFPPQRATVTVARGHADQRGDLLAVQQAQCRHLGHQRPREHRADAWHALQHLVCGPPPRAGADRCRQVRIGARQAALQPGDVRLDVCANPVRRTLPAATLGREPLHPRRRRVSRALQACAWASGSGRGVGRTASATWARPWASRGSVLANRPVALAKSRAWRGFTTTTGRAASARAPATGTSSPPVASSTISAGWIVRKRSTRQGNPRLIIADGPAVIGGTQGDVQLHLGDINADTHIWLTHRCSSPAAQPCAMRTPVGPGNGSGSGQEGRDDPGSPTASHDPRGVGLSRPMHDGYACLISRDIGSGIKIQGPGWGG